MSKEKIEEVQKKAKELGHCLCHLKIKCPCIPFTKWGQCRCAEEKPIQSQML